MSTITEQRGPTVRDRPSDARAPTAERSWRDPRYQTFWLLRLGFTALPILFGIDQFLNLMVYWPQYLADWIANIVPASPQHFMYFVGAVEIVAGVITFLKPRYGAYLVAAWLAGIVINLVSYGGWYDIAVRDFGLMVGALALARLAAVYDPPLRRPS
jgi:DoxX